MGWLGRRLAQRRELSGYLPRHADVLSATATILGEKADQSVHAREIRGIDQLAADALLIDQASSLQVLQVKGEG